MCRVSTGSGRPHRSDIVAAEMSRIRHSPAALSRALFAWLAMAALLPGVFEHHGTFHAFGHRASGTEPLEVSEVGHPGQALHIEATQTFEVAPCPACLHAQSPSLVLTLAPLAGRGGSRGDLASAEPSVVPRRELGSRSARAPPRS